MSMHMFKVTVNMAMNPVKKEIELVSGISRCYEVYYRGITFKYLQVWVHTVLLRKRLKTLKVQ